MIFSIKYLSDLGDVNLRRPFDVFRHHARADDLESFAGQVIRRDRDSCRQRPQNMIRPNGVESRDRN